MEVCSTVKSVMYLFKYVHKGHDVATVGVSAHDEIQRYIDARYVSAPEAVWRLFSFHLQDRSHVIVRLAVHLEGMHNVFFRPAQLIPQVDRVARRDTTLTAYFRLNAADPNARQYLYHEVPNHYCWNATTTTWTRRKTNTGQRIIGRMYSVSPLDRQRFFLRLLLVHRRGCVSFVDLKTIDGVVHLTYEAAAVALGLLEDDAAWSNCLAEASRHDTPRQVRALFVIVCVYCLPADPLALYNHAEAHMMEDFSRDRPEDRARAACLNAINQLLGTHGKSLADFGLPVPDVLEELHEAVHDAVVEAERGEALLRRLNVDQRAVYDGVMTAVMDPRPSAAKVFFVNGPGGTGKTMLYSCLMSVLRGQGRTVLAVAFTGIAAALLDGGRTAHSTFGLPFGNLTYESTSTVRLQSHRARRIRDAALIVWDEAPMSPGFQLTVVDRLLKNIMQSDLPFGGKPFLFGGDFRQILPVVPHGLRSDIVGACIKSNELWPVMRQFSLTCNMRADGDKEFAAWLLLLGNGNADRYGDDENAIRVPRRFLCRGPLADFVFPETMSLNNLDDYENKVILCPTNEGCRLVNDGILRSRLRGEATRYLSSDTVECDDPEDAADFPIEFIHSLHPAGLPAHDLSLKVGAIVVLLRNLDAARGLCNGTRMVVIELRRLNFRARLLNSTEHDDIIVPRIPMTSTEDDGLPFKLRRVQFPVRLAFSVTINKLQGQTFDRVGIYLPTPVFTHGQLYVAFSRVRNAASVKIELPTEANEAPNTKNVVFREVL